MSLVGGRREITSANRETIFCDFFRNEQCTRDADYEMLYMFIFIVLSASDKCFSLCRQLETFMRGLSKFLRGALYPHIFLAIFSLIFQKVFYFLRYFLFRSFLGREEISQVECTILSGRFFSKGHHVLRNFIRQSHICTGIGNHLF